MKKKASTLLLSSALLAGGLAGNAAFAQAGGQTNTTQSQAQAAQPGITGSVPVPRGEALYLGLATVSLQDAIAAAQQATGLSTSPTSVELSVENGFLVWQVAIGAQEVLVDAGNGEILQTMQAETDGDSEHETMGGDDDSEHETMAGDDAAEHEGAEGEAGGNEAVDDD